jgi:hypothetical protein
MRRTLTSIAIGTLALTGATAAVWNTKPRQPVPASSNQASSLQSQAARLEFTELLERGPKLQPSARVLGLNQKRVRLVGFMAQMEEPIKGGFYLVSHPMSLDESGAGTGDLPLDAVLVLIPGAEGRVIPQMQGALEGMGTLEVGNRSDADGRVSNFRLILDSDPRLAHLNAAESS